MSINSPSAASGGELEPTPYEEFEDLEYNDAAVTSTEALLPPRRLEMKEFLIQDRLKRDIEQVEKLNIEEVRWFYQSGKKKKWKPFIGSDSISIETEWRCVSRSDTDIRRVLVRGGMYEVDVLDKKCFPVYWSSFNLKGVEESVDIIRGTWFYEANFMPLSEEIAERIEVEHLERWKGCSLDDVRTLIRNTVMHSVKLPHCHVDWYTVNDVYIHSDAVSYRALRNIVQKFGASKTSTSGNKLHRGYREDAMHEDCMPPVSHLVFVVHGIGSKPDRHKIVRNTNEFRLACERVTAKQFTHFIGRVEFLPVEWRTKLILDRGTVGTLMPRKSVGVRQFLNNSAMDIMYYTSPLYRAEIVDGLRKELYRLHGMFMKRNPDYAGKISVFAHSLGTVIMHDIMTGWSPESLFEEYLKKKNEDTIHSVEDLTDKDTVKKLENDLAQINLAKAKIAEFETRMLSQLNLRQGLGFVIDNFFCVGSPLGIFLALRGQRPSDGKGNQDDIIPRHVCRRIFNIYHPADPIAYRFEPLILSHYIGITPLQIHWHGAVQKTPYSEMPTRAYSAESPKEMVNIPGKEPSINSDTVSMDVSDTEEQFDQKELNNDKDESDVDSQGNKNSDEGAVTSPDLTRRSSYLKTISGGAFRVGKALWTRARSSPSPHSKVPDTISPDSSFVSEEEVADINECGSILEKEGSISSSRSCSPAPKALKEMPQSNNSEILKKMKAESDSQSDTLSPELVHLEHRIDYELQEGFTESKLGYASLTSHTSYWSSQDVALFVLMQIHPPSAMTQNVRS